MELFIVQTLFLLILAFVLGSVLGRFVKGRLCGRHLAHTPARVDQVLDANYVRSADKLAARDEGL